MMTIFGSVAAVAVVLVLSATTVTLASLRYVTKLDTEYDLEERCPCLVHWTVSKITGRCDFKIGHDGPCHVYRPGTTIDHWWEPKKKP
jgi:hypothetical protein